MLEIDKLNEIERIIVDRKADTCKYERMTKTPYGHMTLENFDSNLQQGESKTLRKIDNYIKTYLQEINAKHKSALAKGRGLS